MTAMQRGHMNIGALCTQLLFRRSRESADNMGSNWFHYKRQIRNFFMRRQRGCFPHPAEILNLLRISPVSCRCLIVLQILSNTSNQRSHHFTAPIFWSYQIVSRSLTSQPQLYPKAGQGSLRLTL
jgi:hypothetical protein